MQAQLSTANLNISALTLQLQCHSDYGNHRYRLSLREAFLIGTQNLRPRHRRLRRWDGGRKFAQRRRSES